MTVTGRESDGSLLLSSLSSGGLGLDGSFMTHELMRSIFESLVLLIGDCDSMRMGTIEVFGRIGNLGHYRSSFRKAFC